jgi:SAM-dependent methyltransferase
MSFEQKSYDKHAETYSSDQRNASSLERYRHWFDNLTVDLWRHLKMFSVLDPFLATYPQSEWITIGDGHYGTAATYIEKKGSNATAIDLDDSLLKIALEQKMIKSFLRCNAEALPYDSNSFDFSYCKQSYHHFPRPFLAVYEMIRVSRKAILFSEPADWLPLPIPGRILQFLKRGIKQMVRIASPHTDTGNYETSGNYVFTIAEREFEKIALGLNLPAVAFKRYSDIYVPGVEDELYSQNGPKLKTLKRIAFSRKVKEWMGLSRPNNIQAILFKELPNEETVQMLRESRYQYILLPQNPYL